MSDRPSRILVIGGTGHFGGRICRRLLDQPGCELVVSSRNLANAERFVAELREQGSSAQLHAAAVDHTASGFEADLMALHPDIVIHTAGPYQGQDYRVAEACIAAGSHYIDLADGRDFVGNFESLHDAAQKKGLLLISGASTLPGISSVVVASLQDRLASIEAIEISIAPAHQTPRGPGTVAAVLSYCGSPFQVFVDGNWTTMHGWQNLRRLRYLQLGNRLGGACDVPDLAIFPKHIDGVQTVTFHAALEAPWEQVGLWTMGWLTRARLVRDWSRFVPVFRKISQRMIRFGSTSGGMQMVVRGRDAEERNTIATWNLVAHQNHGPEIPCSPALVIARKLLANQIDVRGAHACLDMFSLHDLQDELRAYDIRWETVWSDA